MMYELVVEDNTCLWTYEGDLDKVANDYAKKRNHNSEIFIELYHSSAHVKCRVEENIWINFCMLVKKYEKIVEIKKAGETYHA